jgi:tetratricopeptide (TPR) repeat protein
MTFRQLASPICATLAALVLFSGGCTASEAKRAAREGARLYDGGDYDAALPLLEKAAEKGLKDGELFYQLGYIYDQKSMPVKSREYREKAVPLLEKQATSQNATLETWYYLTALYANLGRDEMAKTARDAVGRFEGSASLSGEDLFRVGRLYQFAGDGGKGAAAYHRAVEAFAKQPNPNATLYALALLADARTDFQSHRFGDAARKFTEAARISPKSAPALYETALAHMGAGEMEQAQADFGQVREENLSTEAQYGFDVARHLQAVAGTGPAMPEEKALLEMDNPSLEAAIKSAADSFRKVRGEPEGGKDAAESKRMAEQRFFTLVAEWMLRGNAIRETSLAGGYADLIRQ